MAIDWIAIGALVVSLASFARTIRRRPEASWSFTRVDIEEYELAGLMPAIKEASGIAGMQYMQLTNDGDGDAFDVRAFGHNCIVYEAEWEKRPDGRWTNKEVTMYPAMPSNGETANLIILPPEGHDEIPCDAEVCIHWKRSPTRLRRCGYTHTPIAGDEDWWNDKDWQIRHRVAERLKLVVEHRRFHHNPKDAETTPNQPISMPNLTPTPDAQARN